MSSPSAPELGDAALLERIAEGDEEAFRDFYRRHAGRVRSLLRHLCRDHDLAQDLLQDVFLAVWRRAETYRPERGEACGWLFAITRYRVFDHRRRQSSAPVPDAGNGRQDRAALEPGDDDLRISLEQALGCLESHQRDALRLAYFGGFTYQESAERLQVPLGTLKSRIRTALRKLNGILR